MFNHLDISIPKVNRIEVDGKRFYVTPENKRYTSVTTLLSAFESQDLIDWRKSVGEKKAAAISGKAARRGSAVHALTEKYLRNEDPSGDLQAEPNYIVKQMFFNLRKELDKINNIHCIETPLYSDKLMLAGTVDCIAEYNGKLAVIDFKTSSRLKKKEKIENYFLQGCAYGTMYEEMTGIHIDQVCIIIAVENTAFCQVMKVKSCDYTEMLNSKIAAYHERNGNTADDTTGKHNSTETLC